MSLAFTRDERAWARLMTFAGQLPGALLFLGPSGVGKKAHAVALFQFLNCADPSAEEPCGRCASCHKIASGNHSDLIAIKPSGEHILVDDLREMKTRLFFAPVEAGFRLVIIDEAHRMNASSANALLKTLEEPPAHTRLILITHERSRLLPTILSRVQIVPFAPLKREAIRAAAKKLAQERGLPLGSALMEAVTDLAGDGVGRLDSLITAEGIEWLRRLLDPAKPVSPEDLEGEDKLETALDLIPVLCRTKSMAAGVSHDRQWELGRAAMEAAALRTRLEFNANRKLVALNAALLLHQSGARA